MNTVAHGSPLAAPVPEPARNREASFQPEARADATRWLAILRVLLLPIVFAGDRLVAHPKVGTAGFNLVFAIACAYALAALIWSQRQHARPLFWLFACLDLVFICALTWESGGGFSQLHWAFLFLPLGAAILLDPRRTAAIAVVAETAYLVVALMHPSLQPKQLDSVLVQGLYIGWVGLAATVLSALLARRQARIAALAAERGSLVAQALAAEDRARHRLADELHDSAIQNLLAARQDLADARAGESHAIDRSERALRLALDQLRSTVRELHPYLLGQLGLASGLQAIADQYARHGGYDVELRVDPDAVGVSDQLVFSLARELLSNVSRHAHAKHAALELDGRARSIALTVTDDGCGVEPQHLASSLRRGHIGLASCRERVRAVGGGFEIRRPAGGGTAVSCEIPRPGRASPRKHAAAPGPQSPSPRRLAASRPRLPSA